MGSLSTLRGRAEPRPDRNQVEERIRRLVAEIGANPEDPAPLEELATLSALAGRLDEAIEGFTRAAEICRGREQIESAIVFLRNAERLSTAEKRVQILLDLIPLYRELAAYPILFQTAREVVEYHSSRGEPGEAERFLKDLPLLGERDSWYREQLAELLKDLSGRTSHDQRTPSTWLVRADQGIVREDFTALTVLLVDDSPPQLKLYSQALEPLGCKLTLAQDGLEALERITENRPSLIICDLVMPRMDGSQLFERLQGDPALEAIPFVCLSVQDEESEIVAALERGVEEYWVKPVRPKVLRARTKRILRRIKDYAALSGSLSEIGLPDLLQMIEGTGQTGTLILESAGRSAAIYVVDGRPMDAVFEGREAEAAIYAVAGWREGHFQFSPRLPGRPQRIFHSAHALMLEALRRSDEEARFLGQLPSDREVRLTLGTSPEAGDLPARCTAEDMARVRAALEGRTLRQALDELRGHLESLEILVFLHRNGMVKVVT